jgi:hypothetical protein
MSDDPETVSEGSSLAGCINFNALHDEAKAAEKDAAKPADKAVKAEPVKSGDK